jgi:hypothetical protein
MIKAELKEKHPAPVLLTLRKALQRCRDRGDRGGLVRVHGPHQDRARRAQQVSATPKRVVFIVIGRSAPRPSLALEGPPTLLARAGEVIEIELSCAARESGTQFRSTFVPGFRPIAARSGLPFQETLGEHIWCSIIR